MDQTQFSRQLIVLRAVINGYTGHARLFNCPTGQELELRVQTPGGMRALYAAVVERCEQGYRGCPLGALTVDERGQGTGAFSLTGSGVTPEILAIVEQSGDSCMLAMSGFLSGSRDVNWAGVRSAACEAVALNACSGCTPGIQPRDADSAATELPDESTPRVEGEPGSADSHENRPLQSSREQNDGARDRSPDRHGHSDTSGERQGHSRSGMRDERDEHENRDEHEDRDEHEERDDRDEHSGRSRSGMRDERDDHDGDRDEYEDRDDRDERSGRSRSGMRDERGDRRSRSGMRDESRDGSRHSSDERNGSDRTSDRRNSNRRSASGSAAETAGIDRDCDWPEEIAALAPLFASQPAVTPFAGSRYTFIAVPASEAQPAFFAGIWAANGYPRRVAYAIRGDSPTLQPQGLESFLWRPSTDGGCWTTYIDALTGLPVSGDY